MFQTKLNVHIDNAHAQESGRRTWFEASLVYIESSWSARSIQYSRPQEDT